jgi:hypothetical protein
MDKAEMKALVTRVKAGLKITKVVATRSVKGKYGDTFVGFSAAWNSVQEDGGHGVAPVMDDGDEARSLTGMTMEDAIVASCIVAREADIAAYRNAAAGGNISQDSANNAIAAIRSNYSKMIVQALGAASEAKPEAPKDSNAK